MRPKATRRAGGLLLTLLAAALAAEARAEGPADQTLRDKGLKKQGVYYVLDDEGAVFTALDELRPAFQRMKEARLKLTQAQEREAFVQQYQAAKAELEAELRVLPRYAPLAARHRLTSVQVEQRQEVTAYRAQLTHELAALNAQAKSLATAKLTPQKWDALRKDFEEKRTDFLAAEAREAAPMFEKLTQKYQDLKQDAAVKNALNAVGTAQRFTAKLGPSPALLKEMASLRNAERDYAPEAAAAQGAKRKGRTSMTLKGLK